MSISRNGARADADVLAERRMLALAYITAATIPPVGFIIGMIVMFRPGRRLSKHGLWVVAISIAAAIVWVLLLTSGVLDTSTTDLN
jgi:hypothetical protein